MRLSRSVETLDDLRAFVAMCETAGISPGAKVSARVRISAAVRELWVDDDGLAAVPPRPYRPGWDDAEPTPRVRYADSRA